MTHVMNRTFDHGIRARSLHDPFFAITPSCCWIYIDRLMTISLYYYIYDKILMQCTWNVKTYLSITCYMYVPSLVQCI